MKPEEFKAKMEAFITDKADLTSEEAEKALPLFHAMKEEQRNLNHKIHKLKKQLNEGKETDYGEALRTMTSLNVEAAKIEESYYKKMCKVISPKKAYGIKMADDAFHRQMLERFNNRPPKRDR